VEKYTINRDSNWSQRVSSQYLRTQHNRMRYRFQRGQKVAVAVRYCAVSPLQAIGKALASGDSIWKGLPGG
jgi:hypothetical protein